MTQAPSEKVSSDYCSNPACCPLPLTLNRTTRWPSTDCSLTSKQKTIQSQAIRVNKHQRAKTTLRVKRCCPRLIKDSSRQSGRNPTKSLTWNGKKIKFIRVSGPEKIVPKIDRHRTPPQQVQCSDHQHLIIPRRLFHISHHQSQITNPESRVTPQSQIQFLNI